MWGTAAASGGPAPPAPGPRPGLRGGTFAPSQPPAGPAGGLWAFGALPGAGGEGRESRAASPPGSFTPSSAPSPQPGPPSAWASPSRHRGQHPLNHHVTSVGPSLGLLALIFPQWGGTWGGSCLGKPPSCPTEPPKPRNPLSAHLSLPAPGADQGGSSLPWPSGHRGPLRSTSSRPCLARDAPHLRPQDATRFSPHLGGTATPVHS